MAQSVSSVVAQLIQEKMATGQYASEDELLTEALQALDTADDELRAVQDGLDAFDRGEPGISLDEAFQKLRDKHRISDLS